MLKRIFLIQISMIFLTSIAQETNEIIIRKSADTLIHRILVNKDNLTFNVINRDTLNKVDTIYLLNGNISAINKDSITIYLESFYKRTIKNDVIVKEIHFENYVNDSIKSLEKFSFCKNDIYSIRKNRYGGNPYLTVGILSLVTGLIASPLISINYKDGNFNKNLYYRTTGISLIFSILNFSLIPTVMPKYWFKKYDKKIKYKKMWEFK